MKLNDRSAFEEQPLKKKIGKEAIRIGITLAAMVVLTLAVAIFDIPNPNMILITGLVVFTSLFGFPSGIVCTVDMIIYSMYFFSADHSFFEFTPVNLEKIGVIILGTVICLLFIGTLKKEQTDAHNELMRSNYLLDKANGMLKQANDLDPLTGVKNRQALMREGCMLIGEDLFVVIFDLDDFSSLCDNYGHHIGDAVVKKTAQILSEVFRYNVCYRFGGNQFAAVLKGYTEEKLKQDIEEVKIRISEIDADGVKINCTFSAGYVFGTPEQRDDFELMLRHADSMRSKAKHEGKDRAIGEPYLRSVALCLHDRPHIREF